MSLGKKRMEEEAAGDATGAEPEVIEKDDDERELEKLEKSDPEMLRICSVILDQLDNFKVCLCVKMTKLRIYACVISLILLINLHLLDLICVCVYMYIY